MEMAKVLTVYWMQQWPSSCLIQCCRPVSRPAHCHTHLVVLALQLRQPGKVVTLYGPRQPCTVHGELFEHVCRH